MIFRNFRLNVLVRVVLLLGLGYAAIFVWTQTHFWLVSFWLGLAAFLLTLDLLRYVEKSDRELVSFLDAIRQNDFSNSYASPRPHAPNERLRRTLHGLMRVLQRLSQEKESNHQYLQTVVEHVSVALVSFETNGRVALLNTAAKQLLGKPFLLDLSSLRTVDPALYEAVRSLRPGKPALVKYLHQGSLLTLSLQSTFFRLKDHDYTLVSFRDIRPELEQQEAESWQKLIRVLTHEIMNSVIPITNLSEVVNEMLAEKSDGEHSPAAFAPEEVADLRGSLQTIGRRSKGLAQFVKAYGQLTRLPPPNLQEVPVAGLLERVVRLLRPGLEARGIRLELTPLPPLGLSLPLDPEQIEQVLINLLLNAADAVDGSPTPTIALGCTAGAGGQTLLQVRDNGPGIPPEELEQIFVPFYTTKPQGSGIGLSLSRQIMRQHHGSLRVQSEVGKGTVFTLAFL
jgi:two-component system nitrogen regulation sensor histidine kinase NtrY